jgi:hypothetical protein
MLFQHLERDDVQGTGVGGGKHHRRRDAILVGLQPPRGNHEALTDVAAFGVMTVQELHTPAAVVDLSELSRAERDQINYWKPATLGDLLFNFWD